MAGAIDKTARAQTVGILRADWIQAKLSAQFGEYPAMLEDLLATADFTPELRTYNVVDGEFPQDIDECGSYLISGSTFSAYADADWIAQLIDFVRAGNEKKKPVAGICFGHQLIALALGGKVEKSDRGWGIGVHSSTLHAQAPAEWRERLPETINLLHSHQDQVVTMPPDASLIASSEFCPVSIFTVGDHMLGVQGHPEFSAEFASAVYASREHLFPSAVYEKAQSSVSKPTSTAEVARLIAEFLSSNSM